MKAVHVVSGGTSSEREVSLRSGAAICSALKSAGYDARTMDTDAPMLELFACDVIFPVLHGKGGEDGTLQTSWEQHDIPFVGSDAVSSARCFNKQSYKDELRAAHITVPQGMVLDVKGYKKNSLKAKRHVVKPIDGGSSLDTFIVHDPKTFEYAPVYAAMKRYGTMLVEELIIGQEITVGILDAEALPVIEIIPPKDQDFDYENKYNGKTIEACPPLHISKSDQEQAKSIALYIHKLLGCRDLSRTDMIVSRNGTIYVLETNTLPGMTETSLYPKMARAIGLSMPELAERFVQMALSRS